MSEPESTLHARRLPWPSSDHGTRVSVGSVAAWVVYLVGSALVLRSVVISAIVADDFINPFVQYDRAGVRPESVLEYSWVGTRNAGHFNYIGQIIGGAYNTAWLLAASVLGIRLSTFYALTRFIVYVWCACSAATYLRAVAERSGFVLTPWRARIALSAALFLSLQLHNLWSNDPVASYPLSGFASVALGFVYLRMALELDEASSWKRPLVVGVFGLACVLYYEINAAAVAAGIIPVAWIAWQRRREAASWASALMPGLALAVPVLGTLVLQLQAAPESVNYGGTAVDVSGGRTVETFAIAMRSSLPGAGWSLTRIWSDGDMPLSGRAFVVLAIVGTVIALLAVRYGISAAPARTRATSVGTWCWLTLAPLAYWVGATLLQASTQKVQAEVTKVGQVYNFYAVGATAVAAVIAFAVVCFPKVAWRPYVLPPLLVACSLFAVVQLSANESLSARFNRMTIPNQRLHVAYSEQLSVPERCTALINWSNGGWPDYYEIGMIEGLDTAYQRFHGEAFCPGFVRTP